MEAWQGREQQHRQVSGSTASVCLQRHRNTEGGGVPARQHRRVCSVSTGPCYAASPGRRGCRCPAETWSTAGLGKACWPLWDFSNTLPKGQTLSLSEPCRKKSLLAPQHRPIFLPATRGADAESLLEHGHPTVKNKKAGDGTSYLRWQKAAERNRLPWDWGGFAVAVLPI